MCGKRPTNVYGIWKTNFVQIHVEVINVTRKYVWYMYSILSYVFIEGPQVSAIVNLDFDEG